MMQYCRRRTCTNGCGRGRCCRWCCGHNRHTKKTLSLLVFLVVLCSNFSDSNASSLGVPGSRGTRNGYGESHCAFAYCIKRRCVYVCVCAGVCLCGHVLGAVKQKCLPVYHLVLTEFLPFALPYLDFVLYQSSVVSIVTTTDNNCNDSNTCTTPKKKTRSMVAIQFVGYPQDPWRRGKAAITATTACTIPPQQQRQQL